MANIKNLRMWESICTDARVSITKTFFGLHTAATYLPTNSVIDAGTFEYSPEDGKHLKSILGMPKEKMADSIGDYHPKTTDYGNYLVEVAVSRDKRFLAVQLFQFVKLNYEPMMEVIIFEGEAAMTVSKLFR